MKEREALKLALEGFEKLWLLGDHAAAIANPYITAIKEALAQPEREPACFVYPEFFGRLKIAGSATAYLTNGKNGEYPDGVERISLFRAPPQHTWVGLTDEEISSIAYNTNPLDGIRAFSRAIEAKLKKKNT